MRLPVQRQKTCMKVTEETLTPSSVLVGKARSDGNEPCLLVAKMVVVKPAGPSVPYMPTRVLSSPLESIPASRFGAAHSTQDIVCAEHRYLCPITERSTPKH